MTDSPSFNPTASEEAWMGAAVASWVDELGEPPADFAARVSTALANECHGAQASPTVDPLDAARRRRRQRAAMVVPAVVAVAAAVLLVVAIGLGGSPAPETGAANVLSVLSVSDASKDEPSAGACGTEAPTVSVLRGQMRQMLSVRCAPCHNGSDASAVPGALEVFDVEAPQWWTTVSNRQLGIMQQRVDDSRGADSDEGHLVDAFVRAELANRRG